MKLRLCHGDLHLAPLRTRMPFKYGIATMTETTYAFVRLRVEIDGRSFEGIAADSLPPKWFTKDPLKPLADEVAEMLAVIRHALAVAVGLRGENAFEVWQQLYAVQGAWGAAQAQPSLLTHFGTSLVERALLEAVSRAAGPPFGDVLRAGGFGLQLGQIHPALARFTPAQLLPERPLAQLIARHTVGLSDPLTDEEIPADERLNDGLPQSLVACIRAYGLRHFKLKLNGDAARDLDRTQRIAAILREHAAADFAFSLDGNEQFKTLGDFRRFWEEMQRDAGLREFLRHLLFVEQPLHRNQALQPEVGPAFAAWPDRPPFIIDESDGALDSLPAALALGYSGTSHKNCKGVFKGVANRCLLRERERGQPHVAALMSGEDLCNVGPVALLQDLAVMATLGIASVERNGHHYHRGLSQFPAEIQAQVLRHHPDLYQASAAGWPTLRLRDGLLDLGTVNAAPLGVGFAVVVEQFRATS